MASKAARPMAKAAAAKSFQPPYFRREKFWQHTGKVVAIGRNYADHIAELGNQRPSKPFFFLKPASCIVPPVHYNKESEKLETGVLNMLIPAGVNVHYEVELAVIMAHPWGGPRPQNPNSKPDGEGLVPWEEAIQGYAIGIDMTARNVQDEAKKAGLPWTAAKGYDTFLPVSKFITKDKIPDPHDVRLQLQVNGKVVQDDNTNLMLFKIPELFQAVSQVMTLRKGDVVLTGTPKGVGQIFDGDVMKASCFVGDQLIESFEITAKDRKTADGTPY